MSDEAEKSSTDGRPAQTLTRADLMLGAVAFACALAAGLVVLTWRDSAHALSQPQAIIATLIFLAYGFSRRGVALRFLFRWNASVAHTVGALRAKRLVWIYVVDGDTLDDALTGVRYRLANIDAPETGRRAKSTAERRLGAIAKNVARKLVGEAARIEVRPTGKIDHYGRIVAYILLDDRDLGQTMLARRLARPWRGRRDAWTDKNGQVRL